MSTMPLMASCAVIHTPSSISNTSPAIRLPPKTYRSPTILLPRTAFVVQMLTLPLCKHRATGRLERLRARNRRSTGTGATGSRLFCVAKWQRQHFGIQTSKATIVANPPTLRSFAWSNSSPPSKRASPFSTRSPATSTSRRSATALSPSSPSSSSRPSSAW